MQKNQPEITVERNLALSASFELPKSSLRGKTIVEGQIEDMHLPLNDKDGLLTWQDIQDIGSKRKDKEPEHTHSSKFLSCKHEKHFKIVQYRRLLMERKVGMIPELAPQFGEQRDYLSYVRGHAIWYDPESINRFLDTEWVGEQCQFALNMEEGTNFDDVESVLCVLGRHFQRNKNDAVLNIRRIDLTSLAKYWMDFSHANLQPCSYVSDITDSRELLLYCVLRGISINIGQVIANEIQVCANTMNTKAPLGHPSLITHLCELAGVNISVPPFERPRKAIDEAYYRQHCGGDEAAQPVPPRHPRRGRGPPQGQASVEIHEAEAFQMRDMYMSLIDAQMQSIQRGQVATTEMIIGMYDTPPKHSGSLPLSGTQKPTLAPLRGEKAAKGKKRTRALTAER
ncbi:hypothetical protein LR48_Vigan08g054000 [Vigna angularis]|uniref:Putative plant transposon protein domain-containing protein n=1 Tax=Phaseolus angularis TaxID=3914 RepID=A0A0L9V3X7_PHAAN|nr:hypothetical protein LR48_Vigan08g054000 [Vigna angularis]